MVDRMRNSYVDLDDPTDLEFRSIRLIADIINTESPQGALQVVSIGRESYPQQHELLGIGHITAG